MANLYYNYNNYNYEDSYGYPFKTTTRKSIPREQQVECSQGSITFESPPVVKSVTHNIQPVEEPIRRLSLTPL